MEALLRKVVGLLQQTSVIGRFSDFDGCQAQLRSVTTEVMKAKSEWLSEADVLSIFFRHIYEALQGAAIDWGESKQLKSVISPGELDRLGSTLTAFFTSVPLSYEVRLPLPQLLLAGSKLEIGPGMALTFSSSVTGAATDAIQGGLLGVASPPADDVLPSLEVGVAGYAGSGMDTSAGRKALTAYKLSMHQLLSAKLLHKRAGIITEAASGWNDLHAYRVPKHRAKFLSNGASSSAGPPDVNLSIEICHFVDTHQFWLPVSEQGDHDGQKSVLRKVLEPVARLLHSNVAGAGRIRTACEWGFDAYLSVSPTMALIQTSIGLEALFGEEKDSGGLTRMLSDRCAYLIGRNFSERGELRSKFEKFYEVRSKVVHGNALTLSADEMGLMWWGRAVLDTAIQKELQQLSV